MTEKEHPVEEKEEDASEPEVAQEEPVVEEESEESTDELSVLRQELEETQAKEAEYLDGWQRARAELANARKRFQRERDQAYTNAKADVFARVLPIVDDFERALGTLPDNLADDPWTEGMRLVQHKFNVLLEQDGVTPIEAAGEEFDPFFHQAITHEPSNEVEEGHVIAEVQKGYKMGDQVLRASVVRVSAGSPPEPKVESEPEAEVEDEAPPEDQE